MLFTFSLININHIYANTNNFFEKIINLEVKLEAFLFW